MKELKKKAGIFYGIITFVITVLISIYITINYWKLYENKQYADMIACSESFSTQVYKSMMNSFSKVSSLAEMTTIQGIDVANNVQQLEGLKIGTKIKGMFFAPNGKIEAVYPKKDMENYLGLDFSESFPEKYDLNVFKSDPVPAILGPYEVPSDKTSANSDSKSMTVIAPYFRNTKNGREMLGVVGLVVDYPEIFSDVDLSLAKEKDVLCKIWRYNNYTSEIQTLLETEQPMPEKITTNNTTFQKLYFTAVFCYSFVPKKTFFHSTSFYIILICLLIFCVLASFSVYHIINGIKNSQELKFYRIQSKLIDVQEHTIISLSNLVENRDSDTGEHVRRTSDYVYLIAKAAKAAGLYTEILTDNYIETLKKAAPMHDIGKIVVPDAILKKPGKLTPEEFEQIKTHTSEGAKIINEILGPVQTPEMVAITREIAKYHHEKWNGKGYPCGLKENEIPLSARIMSLADVFDALTTPRCYKEPFSFEKAIEIIKEDKGVAFDPALTDIFLLNQPQLRAIMNRYF